MIMISFANRSKLGEDRDFIPTAPAGEKAIMTVRDAQLHPELATLLPRTSIVPLASHPAMKRATEEEHIYMVSVRGYSLDEFEALAFELLNGKYDKFLELVNALAEDY